MHLRDGDLLICQGNELRWIGSSCPIDPQGRWSRLRFDLKTAWYHFKLSFAKEGF